MNVDFEREERARNNVQRRRVETRVANAGDYFQEVHAIETKYRIVTRWTFVMCVAKKCTTIVVFSEERPVRM